MPEVEIQGVCADIPLRSSACGRIPSVPPLLHMAFLCVRGSVGTPSAPLVRLRVLAFTADPENPG